MWKSRLVFAFALSCLIVLYFFYPDKDLIFTGIYALLLLVLCSLLGVLCSPLLIKVEEETSADEMFKMDSLRYACQIVNRGIFFYPRIQCQYYNDAMIDYQAELFSVLPRGRAAFARELQFPYRGVYAMGLKRITVMDALGLFRISFPVRQPLIITVFPSSDEGFSQFVRNESQHIAMRRELSNESYADVADVRKYTSSDHFRKIHWKLSAKRNELMVKNFQSFAPNKTVLFVDPVKLPLPQPENDAFADKVMSFAASAVDFCMNSHQPAYLASGQPSALWAAIDPAGQPDHVYRVLAKLAFSSEQSALPDFLSGLERDAVSYHLLLFLSVMDETIFDALVQFASYDDTIYVYFFFSAQFPLSETVQQYLDGLRTEGIMVSCVEVGQAVNSA